MLLRSSIAILKWSLTLGALGALLAFAYFAGTPDAEEHSGGTEEHAPEPGGVVLAAADADRFGLTVEKARAIVWRPRTVVYGRVVPNPRATFEVRAPAAGILRADADHPWPVPGRSVRSAERLGWLDVRVSPQERLVVEENLRTAQLKQAGAAKIVAIYQQRVERLKNATRPQIVTAQQVEDARVLLAEAQTRLEVAKASVALWERALAALSTQHGSTQRQQVSNGTAAETPAGRRPTDSVYRRVLTAPAEGRIVDVAAHPGSTVEAGALVARVVDLRKPLARLDLPRHVVEDGPPAQVHLSAAAAEAPLDHDAAESALLANASLVGPAPDVDAASQFVGYWYAIEPAGDDRDASTIWKPGLTVQATIDLPGRKPIPAVAVPAGAVLFRHGHALVYVRRGVNRYEPRRVHILGRDREAPGGAPNRIIVAQAGPDTPREGIRPEEPVVATAAGVLHSIAFHAAP